MTRPTADDKVREAFSPVDGVATVSTTDAASSLGCSPPAARHWAASIGIRPRRRIGKKKPRSDRIAPYGRRVLVKRLESIGGRLLKIQEVLEGTPDKAPASNRDSNETGGAHVENARGAIIEATKELSLD